MTTIKRLTEGSSLTGLEVSGHAEFAEYGSDVVCAALSALTQSAYLAIKELTNVKLKMQRREGYFSFRILSGAPEEREKAELILRATIVGLEDLEKGYPDNLRMED